MTQEFKDKVVDTYVALRMKHGTITHQYKGYLDLFDEARHYRFEGPKFYRRPLSLPDEIFSMIVDLSSINGPEYSELSDLCTKVYYEKMDVIWAAKREKRKEAEERKEAKGKEMLSTVKIGDVVVIKCGGIKYRKVIEISDEHVTGWVLHKVGSVGHVFRKTLDVATNNCKFIIRVIDDDDAIISHTKNTLNGTKF